MFLEPGLSRMIAVSLAGSGIWMFLELTLPGMIAVSLAGSGDMDVSRIRVNQG
jgi:hypothetical protein